MACRSQFRVASLSYLFFPVPGFLRNGILCTWFGISGHAGIVSEIDFIESIFYDTSLKIHIEIWNGINYEN